MCSITGRLLKQSNKSPGQPIRRNIPLVDDMASYMSDRLERMLNSKEKEEKKAFGTHWKSFIPFPSTDRILLFSSSYDAGTWTGYVSKHQADGAVVQTVIPDLGTGSLMVKSPVAGDDNGITCAFDKGYVVTYDSRLNEVQKVPVHDNIITGLLSGNDGRFITTCSADWSISQVDMKTGVTRKRIRSAHRSHVLSIDCLPSNDSNIFLTCGKDNELVTWDLRELRSGSHFYTLPQSCPSTVKFCTDENYFQVGTYDGHVLLFDMRKNVMEVQSREIQANSRIHRIKSLARNELFAVISDHRVLTILKEKSLDCVYEGSGSVEASGWIRDAYLVGPFGHPVTVGYGVQQCVQHHLLMPKVGT